MEGGVLIFNLNMSVEREGFGEKNGYIYCLLCNLPQNCCNNQLFTRNKEDLTWVLIITNCFYEIVLL